MLDIVPIINELDRMNKWMYLMGIYLYIVDNIHFHLKAIRVLKHHLIMWHKRSVEVYVRLWKSAIQR